VFARAGFLSLSHKHLRHRLSTREAKNSPSLTCALLGSWAVLLAESGQYRSGIKVVARLMRLGNPKGVTRSSLEWKCELACALMKMGQTASSLRVLVNAIRVHGRHAPFDSRLRARILRLLFRLSVAPDSSRIVQALNRVLASATRRDMWWHVSLGILGKHAARAAIADSAERYTDLLQIVHRSRVSGNRTFLWQSYYWLGRCHERKLQQERALHRYRIAVSIIHEIARELRATRFEESYL
jgi:hypothetical protein